MDGHSLSQGCRSLSDLVSADLLSSENSSYRGCLDGFEPESGLLGWALNLDDPNKHLVLRFRVDGMMVFEVMTSHPRPDVSTAIGRHGVHPGFCIPKVELCRLAQLVEVRPAAEFSVEIGTTSLFLPRIDTLPTLRDAVASSMEQQRFSRREAASFERLAQTWQDAEPLTAQPLRPFEETRIGFIEAICAEDQNSDLTWIIGWSLGGKLRNAPIVLVDGRKFHGAIMACDYPRSDLPAGGAGFVGVIQSKWRVRQTSKLIVYVGATDRHHLVSVADLQEVSKEDICGYVERYRFAGNQANWGDLYNMLTAQDSWVRRPSNHLEIQVGVDQLILVSQFGCFVSGWALSYARAIEGFVLKLGSNVLSMDRTSLAIRPRPDLTSAFPGCASVADRAGFTCLFPGHFDADDLEAPLLKIVLEGGVTMIHPIGITHIRRLGETISFDVLLHLYPSLETERFFPSLVSAVRQGYVHRNASFEANELKHSKQALLIAAPTSHDDCFLLVENIRHSAPRYLNSETGIIFLAIQEHKQRNLIRLIRELCDDLLMPCNVVFIPKLEAALYNLKDILLVVGAKRFCFIAANDVLTQMGWEAVGTFMRSGSRKAIAFESVDPESFVESRDRVLSFGCEWDTFVKLTTHLDIKLDCCLSALTLLKSVVQDPDDIIKAGTFFTRKITPGAVTHLINGFDRRTDRAFSF